MNDLARSHLRPLLPFVAALTAALTLAAPAHADDADKAACEGKQEGDACTRGDGGEGTCSIDEDDDVLSCDDDATGSDDGADDGGCSVGAAPGAGGSGAWLGVGLALALGRRRRRG